MQAVSGSGPRVRMSYGNIRGVTNGNVHCFRGIPYAAPPVGELRFRAPQPPLPWKGDRPCTQFGNAAMQGSLGEMAEMIGIAAGPMDEDCLTLNVWTGGLTDDERPVMVWIHGGANIVGASSQPRFDSEYFVHRGDMVLVTINYRLGAFGFLRRHRQRGAARPDRGAALGAQGDPQVRRRSESSHRVRAKRRRSRHPAVDGDGSGGRLLRPSDRHERRAYRRTDVAADTA